MAFKMLTVYDDGDKTLKVEDFIFWQTLWQCWYHFHSGMETSFYWISVMVLHFLLFITPGAERSSVALAHFFLMSSSCKVVQGRWQSLTSHSVQNQKLISQLCHDHKKCDQIYQTILQRPCLAHYPVYSFPLITIIRLHSHGVTIIRESRERKISFSQWEFRYYFETVCDLSKRHQSCAKVKAMWRLRWHKKNRSQEGIHLEYICYDDAL